MLAQKKHTDHTRIVLVQSTLTMRMIKPNKLTNGLHTMKTGFVYQNQGIFCLPSRAFFCKQGIEADHCMGFTTLCSWTLQAEYSGTETTFEKPLKNLKKIGSPIFVEGVTTSFL